MSREMFEKTFELECRRVKEWIAEQPNFVSLDVDYNELIKSPDPQIAVIDDFLGGGLDSQAMSGVVEPGLYRQRK